MRVVLVVVAGQLGEHAQLRSGEQTVRHADAQHGRVALNIQAVLQAQRAEFLFAQFAGQVALGLAAELRDPLLDDPLIVFVVYVHVMVCSQAVSGGRCPLRGIRWPARGIGGAHCGALRGSGGTIAARSYATK
ncbi:hypothetical protein D9M71_671150 [compost metagenome]